MISDADLRELKSRPANHCGIIAKCFGVTLRSAAGRMTGPCPLCCTDIKSRKHCFEIKDKGAAWVCAKCRTGGDCIALVMAHQHLNFRAAVEWLGRPREIDPALAEACERERKSVHGKRDSGADYFRERERKTLYRMWSGAEKSLSGTPVEAYLRKRSIDMPLGDLRLRYIAKLPFFDGEEIGPDGRKYSRIVHRGPAMVAPLTDNGGKFRGCQFTWIDPTSENGKALIRDPQTGEEIPTNGRKIRGSSGGAHIDIVGSRFPKQIVVGEGVETVLSVWQAMMLCGIDLADTAGWAAIDLGNLGGPAKGKTIRYCGDDGKLRWCSGLDPDLDRPGIELPESVDDVIMLGDGDSHPIPTQAGVWRGAQRWGLRNAARIVKVAWANPATDFNSMLGAA